MGGSGPCGGRTGRAGGDRHAVPRRLGQDLRRKCLYSGRDGLESETVAIYQADPGLRLYSEVGKRQPLHAGSSRLLLAHAPEAVQTRVLAQRLPRFTPATRTDSAWIAADLQRIRTRGYLITTDEVVAGAATIAGPVRDASGQVVAVLSVSAPTMRMRPPRPRALLPMVLDAAAKLSHTLGAAAGPTASKPAEGRRGQGQPAASTGVPASGSGPGRIRTAFDLSLIVRPLPSASARPSR